MSEGCEVIEAALQTDVTPSRNVEHSESKKFSCDICKKLFCTKVGLTKHLELHLPTKPHCCQTCGKLFSNQYILKYHYTNTHSRHMKIDTPKTDKMVFCKICNKVFKNSKSAQTHLKRQHSAIRQYSCYVCHQKFAILSQLNKHVDIHTGGHKTPCTCDVCHKSFSSICSLNNHKLVHRFVRPYKCGECCKSFQRKSYLMSHLKTHLKRTDNKHDGSGKCPTHKDPTNSNNQMCIPKRVYACNICRKTFKSGATLRVHKRHCVNKYFCGICDCAFVSSGLLKRHMKTHISEKTPRNKSGTSLFCNICNKPFRKLGSHITKHKKQAIYRCEICDTTYYNLKSYEEACIHVQEKFPKCPDCGKIFMHGTSLKMHLSRHTENDKPKPKKKCIECNKEFDDKASFRQHRESHDPDKRFCCEFCGERFFSFNKLYKHLGTHNG